jgi:hypothetical protein
MKPIKAVSRNGGWELYETQIPSVATMKTSCFNAEASELLPTVRAVRHM